MAVPRGRGDRPGWEAVSGHAGHFLSDALLAGGHRCLARRADEPGYPSDLIELLCEVQLRGALGLSDGDRISVAFLGSEPGQQTGRELDACFRA